MVIRVVGHVACGAANFTVYKLYGRVQGGNGDEGRGIGVTNKNGVVAIRAGAHQQGNINCTGSVMAAQTFRRFGVHSLRLWTLCRHEDKKGQKYCYCHTDHKYTP